MNEKLEEFIEQRQKMGSRLTPVREEIMQMRAKDVPFSAINEWIKNEHKINTSCENIRKFVKRYTLQDEEIWSSNLDVPHDEIGKIWILNEDAEPYLAEEVLDV